MLMKGNFVVQKSAKKPRTKPMNSPTKFSKHTVGRLDSMRILRPLHSLCSQDLTLFGYIVKEFETINNPPSKSIAHHEGHSMQIKFRKDVLAFLEVVEQIRNLFCL